MTAPNVVRVPGGFYYPNPPMLAASGTISYATAVTLNATTAKLAWIFQCPKAGTLDWFEFRMNTYTQATNGFRMSFQTVDPATGFPDGVVDQYRIATTTSDQWTWPGSGGGAGFMTSDGTDSGVKRTVTQGEWLACVIDFQSWTTGDSIVVTTGWTIAATDNALHYIANGSTGTYVAGGSAAEHIALKYADGTYAAFPLYAVTSCGGPGLFFVSTNLAHDGVEMGMMFQMPMDCYIDGGWLRVDLDAPCEIKLYRLRADNIVGDTLSTLSLDPQIRSSTAGQNSPFIFPDTVELRADETYAIVLRGLTTTASSVYAWSVSYFGSADYTPVGGAFWKMAYRYNGDVMFYSLYQKILFGVHVSHLVLSKRFIAMPGM